MKSAHPVISTILFLTAAVLFGCSGSGGGEAPRADALPTPTGLTAAAVSSGSIALNWSAASGSAAYSGYKVYRAGTEVGTTASNAWTDTGLASGTTYTYTVACYDGAGNVSTHSAPASATTLGADTAPPSAPADLTATADGPDRIDLVWKESTDNVAVTGYEIWRDAVKLAVVAGTSHTDAGLAPSTSYTYVVKAVDEAGNVSAASNEATASTAAQGAATAITLPRTGQTACYDDLGGQTDCANTGQDGELQKGAAWPSPRFSADPDTSITDNLTGLAWAPNGDLMTSRDPGWDTDKTSGDGKVTWQHALDYVAKLNAEAYLGHTDWRLPNRHELRSLVSYGVMNSASWLNSQGFTGVLSEEYWTSTSWAINPRYAWYVSLLSGYVIDDSNKDETFALWPVRAGDGEYTATTSLPATGQTQCYDNVGASVPCAGTGQDGDLQKGVAWPASRFYDNGDDTMTDALTGLVWPKSGNAPGPSACAPGAAKTWQDAFAYAACLNENAFLGHTDWRVPNLNELDSLLHADQPDNSAWLNNAGFSAVQAGLYWTSTTFTANATDACLVHMLQGDIWNASKADVYFVWPVRGGL